MAKLPKTVFFWFVWNFLRSAKHFTRTAFTAFVTNIRYALAPSDCRFSTFWKEKEKNQTVTRVFSTGKCLFSLKNIFQAVTRQQFLSLWEDLWGDRWWHICWRNVLFHHFDLFRLRNFIHVCSSSHFVSQVHTQGGFVKLARWQPTSLCTQFRSSPHTPSWRWRGNHKTK